MFIGKAINASYKHGTKCNSVMFQMIITRCALTNDIGSDLYIS